VQEQIDFLLEEREHDPDRDLVPRIVRRLLPG
jgi:hypothetical protein